MGFNSGFKGLILTSHILQVLQVVSFLQVSHQNPVGTSSFPHTCHAPHISFNSRVISGEWYILFSFSLCSLLHSPVTSSLLGPNILLSALFSKTLVPSSVRAKELHTHTKQKAELWLCISYSIYFWIANWKTTDSTLNDSKHSLNSLCSSFFFLN